MHHQQGLIATASKDCSVSVCSISDSGEILTDRNFPDHHNGVVKCVRFSPSHSSLLASCGNDRCSLTFSDDLLPTVLRLSRHQDEGIFQFSSCQDALGFV